MMDNRTDMTDFKDTADTAEAERVTAAAGPGKFKDVQALADAYKALEAEFTRRSQRLKELENAIREKPSAQTEAAPPQTSETTPSGSGNVSPADLSDEVKNAVIGEYLSGVLSRRSVPFVTGGSVVAAQRVRPSTLREAGLLAKKFFDHKED